MPATSLDLVLGETAPAVSGDDFLILQQESWDPYVGQLTKMQTVGWLKTMVFQAQSPLPNCPPDMPGFSKSVYAFPSRPGLAFSVGVSNGQLINGPVETIEYSEVVQVGLRLKPALKYPAVKIISHKWLGLDDDDENPLIYDRLGQPVPPPSVTIEAGGLSIGSQVYASLRVSYLVYRYSYTVRIEPRDEYQERKLQSFFWGVWAGGVEHLEIEAPLGEQPEEVTCNNQWQSGVGQFDPAFYGLTGGLSTGDSAYEDEEENPYKPVSGQDIEEYIDYCSQLVIK